jgi:predicted Zn-dependent protease
MNITADPTTPGGLGTFGFDDEGVPAAASRSSSGASSAAS